MTAKAFRAALDGVSAASRIVLNINSPGGDVFDGIAIFNDLLAHKADVMVRVTGLAASAASVIAMAGDDIHIAENAFFMIHNAWSVAIGDSREMTARAKLLNQIDGQLASTYAARTGGDAADIKQQMDDETWLTASDAVDQGFADDVIPLNEGADAAAFFDLSVFRNAPKALKPRRVAKAKAKAEPLATTPLVLDLSPLLAELNTTKALMAA